MSESGERPAARGRRHTLREKKAHAAAGGQTRPHHCRWPGCNAQVPPARWGCKRHWLMLPMRLRNLIWSSYRPGQGADLRPSRAYVEAAREVLAFIAEHPDGRK